MSDEEVTLRKGRLLEEFLAAKTKLHVVQDEARREAKIIEGIAEFLRTGGERGQVSLGAPLEEYLSQRTAKLVADLEEARTNKRELGQRLSELGLPIAD